MPMVVLTTGRIKRHRYGEPH